VSEPSEAPRSGTVPVTVEDCLREAIENLRQAERGWADVCVPDPSVANVIGIANGWLLAAREIRESEPGGDPTPVHLTFGDNVDPQWVTPPRLEDVAPPVSHQWHEISGFCVISGCCAHRHDDNVDAVPCPAVGVARGATKHEHSGLTCGHQWVQPMDPCRNGCGSRPDDSWKNADMIPWELCPKTCPDVNA
jgi:hypothetical protein